MTGRLVDLSHPLSEETPPFPGDPPLEVEILSAEDAIDKAPRSRSNCSRIKVCVHCGTHMDAPFHFFGNGASIDQVALDACVGEAICVDLQGALPDHPHAAIEPGMLAPHLETIAAVPRVILHTGWWRRWKSEVYFEHHPIITVETAQQLISLGTRLIGIDFPSVDRAPFLTHVELLASGVVIVENLTNLAALPTPRFRLLALPLALSGRDGSPVRAVAEVKN